MIAGDGLRIIGGSLKGRKLHSPDGQATRPTLDKVRGAVFNSLYDVSEASVLDLFGGSGAMAIEAPSRGAASAVIADFSPKACDIIKKNVMNFGLSQRVEVRCCDFRQALRPGESYDLILLDPPYCKNLLLESMDLIIKLGALKERGMIVAETSSSEPEICDFPALDVIKTKTYGTAQIWFYRVNYGIKNI